MKAASARDGDAVKVAATHSGLAPKAAETKQAAPHRQSRSRGDRNAAGKTPVFGLLKRNGKVFVNICQGLLKRQLAACYSRINP